jgi:hypothetical protein
MRRLLVTLAIAATAVIAPMTAASAASPAIMITRVYVNSPGSDRGGNTSINYEYVELKNTTTRTINLYHWTVRDKASHIYTFTGTFNLGAGKTVRVHTGKGINTSTNRYWGMGWYVWNNDGDAAYVRNSSGTQIDSCTWGTVSSYKTC